MRSSSTSATVAVIASTVGGTFSVMAKTISSSVRAAVSSRASSAILMAEATRNSLARARAMVCSPMSAMVSMVEVVESSNVIECSHSNPMAPITSRAVENMGRAATARTRCPSEPAWSSGYAARIVSLVPNSTGRPVRMASVRGLRTARERVVDAVPSSSASDLRTCITPLSGSRIANSVDAAAITAPVRPTTTRATSSPESAAATASPSCARPWLLLAAWRISASLRAVLKNDMASAPASNTEPKASVLAGVWSACLWSSTATVHVRPAVSVRASARWTIFDGVAAISWLPSRISREAPGGNERRAAVRYRSPENAVVTNPTCAARRPAIVAIGEPGR